MVGSRNGSRKRLKQVLEGIHSCVWHTAFTRSLRVNPAPSHEETQHRSAESLLRGKATKVFGEIDEHSRT